MPLRKSILALGLIAAASPLAVAAETLAMTAPAGSAETRYCMRVEAATGSRIEAVRCWTRAQWTEQGVDVDRDWPAEGVRTID
jgi:hypothetical protein